MDAGRSLLGGTLAVGAGAVVLLRCCLTGSRPEEQEEEKRKKRPLKVMIAGGGIGGLSCALKLHQAGVDVTVYEMYEEIRSDLGLGINLLPHCTQVLHGLGLARALQATAIQTAKLILGTNRGMSVWEEPRGRENRDQPPCRTFHDVKNARTFAKTGTNVRTPQRKCCVCRVGGRPLNPSVLNPPWQAREAARGCRPARARGAEAQARTQVRRASGDSGRG
jgi:hypothetical protein